MLRFARLRTRELDYERGSYLDKEESKILRPANIFDNINEPYIYKIRSTHSAYVSIIFHIPHALKLFWRN